MASAFGTHPAGLRLERIKASPHFKDGAFVNTFAVAPGLKKGTTFPVLGEFMTGGQTRRPKGELPLHDPRPVWATPVQTGLRVTWLGHSTVLLEFDGVGPACFAVSLSWSETFRGGAGIDRRSTSA